MTNMLVKWFSGYDKIPEFLHHAVKGALVVIRGLLEDESKKLDIIRSLLHMINM